MNDENTESGPDHIDRYRWMHLLRHWDKEAGFKKITYSHARATCLIDSAREGYLEEEDPVRKRALMMVYRLRWLIYGRRKDGTPVYRYTARD